MSNIEVMRQRFRVESVASEQLPITLSNGFEFTELTGVCGHCKNEIPTNALRGNITQVFGVVIFDCHGLCTDCLKMFPVFGRVKPNGSGMLVEYIRNGKWVYSPLKAINPIKRFRKHTLNSFNRLINK